MTTTHSTQDSRPAGRPAVTSGPAIQVTGLGKRFGHVVAVEDVSFTVCYGRITGFLGPNGAGKTTTLRMLLGLIRPDAGVAAIAGQPYPKLAGPAQTVGALLDAAVYPGRSGRDHLRVLATAAGLSSRRATELLERVGLAAAARQRAGGYSLGMRQRLGLAAALLGDPAVLVLDEPANGLDPAGMAELRDLLRSLAAEGRTVLMASHVLSEVAHTVDRVVIAAAGTLRYCGTLEELTGVNNETLEAAFLRLTSNPTTAPAAAAAPSRG